VALGRDENSSVRNISEIEVGKYKKHNWKE
jgi:hypothetical protein